MTIIAKRRARLVLDARSELFLRLDRSRSYIESGRFSHLGMTDQCILRPPKEP